jgi:pimeloyl-ACP methyl ester carboxylesterase
MSVFVQDNVFIRSSKVQNRKGDIWFIHGYGESGLSFQEALTSKLATKFNLYIPDFPGFGVSPFDTNHSSLNDSSELLMKLIQHVSKSQKLYIIAHSLGGIVGTETCKKLSDKVQYFINIEGNITEGDVIFSSLYKDYTKPEAFHAYLCGRIQKQMKEDLSLQRYFSSLRFAQPQMLMNWGKSAVERSKDSISGQAYIDLNCKKNYFWGDALTSKQTQNFLKKNKLKNTLFKGCGHWPMIEQTETCYEAIFNLFNS